VMAGYVRVLKNAMGGRLGSHSLGTTRDIPVPGKRTLAGVDVSRTDSGTATGKRPMLRRCLQNDACRLGKVFQQAHEGVNCGHDDYPGN